MTRLEISGMWYKRVAPLITLSVVFKLGSRPGYPDLYLERHGFREAVGDSHRTQEFN